VEGGRWRLHGPLLSTVSTAMCSDFERDGIDPDRVTSTKYVGKQENKDNLNHNKAGVGSSSDLAPTDSAPAPFVLGAFRLMRRFCASL